eukprot:7321657-Prymnesium_polylepis.2
MSLHFTPNICARIHPQGDAEVKAGLLDQACGRGIHARPYGAAHPQNVAFSWPQVNVGVRSTFPHTTPLDAVPVCRYCRQHYDHVQHAERAAEAVAYAGRVRQRWNGIA